MTYLQFHIAFLLPAIVLLRLLGGSVLRTRASWLVASSFLVTVIAVVYTTPWDQHLVATGVWFYGEDRVLATIGGVPIEEYLFFFLQPLLTSLWLMLVMAKKPPVRVRRRRKTNTIGSLILASATIAGIAMMQSARLTYMGLIVAWAAPALLIQWAYGGGRLWAWRSTVAWAVIPPTVYLCIADRIAIGLGIWTISEQSSTGIAIGGLPVEEAFFFLVTNVLVVNGVLLATDTFARIFGR